jgi:hypothetical protein
MTGHASDGDEEKSLDVNTGDAATRIRAACKALDVTTLCSIAAGSGGFLEDELRRLACA